MYISAGIRQLSHFKFENFFPLRSVLKTVLLYNSDQKFSAVSTVLLSHPESYMTWLNFLRNKTISHLEFRRRKEIIVISIRKRQLPAGKNDACLILTHVLIAYFGYLDGTCRLLRRFY